MQFTMHLVGLAFILLQTGCAGLDLSRSEEFFRPSSHINLPEPQQVAETAPRGLEHAAVKRPPGESPSLPGAESPPRAESQRESNSELAQVESKSLADRQRCSKSGVAFAWKPQLLIRANDEVSDAVKATEEQEEELETLSNATDSPVNEVGELAGLEGIEYVGPQMEADIPLSFASERWRRVKSDYGNFYSQSSLIRLSGAFLIGAAMANTSFDENFTEDVYRDNVIDIANEDIAQTLHQPKTLGDGYILLPTLGVLAVSQPLLERSEWTSPLGELGDRGARAILVGGPVVMITQNLTGASRPYESPSGSRWVPFQDNNGVSGHAFVGAVPFLAAGKMSRQPWAKAVWYGASVLPALSRVNDDRHYFSQVFLGWYIAWLATNAVDDSIQRPGSLRVAPVWGAAGPGLMLEKQF